jgi:hypothetical protein
MPAVIFPAAADKAKLPPPVCTVVPVIEPAVLVRVIGVDTLLVPDKMFSDCEVCKLTVVLVLFAILTDEMLVTF